MPTWTDPITVVDGQVLTASLWNLEIRDKLRALGLSTIQQGQIIQGDGPSSFRIIDGSGLSAQPGTILDYPGPTPPTGYLTCDGSLLSRTTYGDLFDVIGTLFGNEESTLYALTSTGGLWEVDLSDVDNPVRLGGLGSGTWQGLGGLASTLYALTSTGLLSEVDLSDVDNPVSLGDLGSGTWLDWVVWEAPCMPYSPQVLFGK